MKKLAVSLFSKETATFLLFFLLASIFWFLHTIGSKREMTIEVPIKYINIPEDILISSNLPDIMTLQINDEGRRLIDYNLGKKDTVEVDMQKLFVESNGQFLYYTNKIREDIASNLKSTTSIGYFTPTVIEVKYTKLFEKKVPVKLSLDPQLSNQVVLSQPITYTPNEIVLYGQQETLDTINIAFLEPIEENSIDNSGSYIVALKQIDKVKSTIDKVKVDLSVELVTEKKVVLPISGRGTPNGVVIRTFPAFVEVVFSVGISAFNDITEKSFVAEVDYADVEKFPEGKLPIYVTAKTDKIKSLRYNIKDVEYIIEN